MNITSGKIESAKKVVIYGPEGIGKSTFAAQFPNPLFIDTEGSTKYMDVRRMDKPTSWEMLRQELTYVKQIDGKGVKNENITEYRYALVESDSMDIASQNAVIRELELPVACLVYSGGKSLHAIVRVDAGSYEEYRARVDYLYKVCAKNGLDIDKQNRNPSRLSRRNIRPPDPRPCHGSCCVRSG